MFANLRVAFFSHERMREGKSVIETVEGNNVAADNGK